MRRGASCRAMALLALLLAACQCGCYSKMQHEVSHLASYGAQQDERTGQGAAAVGIVPQGSSKRQLRQGFARLRGGCGPFKAEFIAQYARENTVIVSVVDILVMKYFAISWIKNVMAAGIDYWLMAAMDDKAGRFLARRGVRRCFRAQLGKEFTQHPEKKYGWGSSDWGAATWRKVHVVERLVQLGFNVVLSDLDVAWLRDPHAYFVHRWNQYVVLLSSDNLRTQNPTRDDGPEVWTDTHNVLNTGVFYVKAGPLAQRLLAEWLQQEGDHGQDQEGFNNIMRGKATGSVRFQHVPWCKVPGDQQRMLVCMNETIPTGTLSVGVFMHSYTFFVARLHKVLQVRPYEIHFVWGGKGKESKRQRMREALVYHDRLPYYRDGGFLSVEMDYLQMPAGYNTLAVTEDMVRFHLRAMEHQLSQLYHAFGLALALNRTLILPPVRCYCAKNWYMTDRCRILGETATQFPFNCSLGDFIKPRLLVDGLQIGSRTLHIREHTFLENPRTADEVKAPAPVVATVPPGAAEGLATGASPPRVLVSGRVLDSQLQAKVVHLTASSKRLHVPRPWEVFGGFEDGAFSAQFTTALQGLPTYWCCRSPADQEQLKLKDRVQYKFVPEVALTIPPLPS